MEDTARELTQAVNNLTRVVTNLDELLRRDYPKRTEIERRFMSKQESRRLFIQGLILVLMMCGLGTYVTIRVNQTQSCFQGKFAALSSTYEARASLAEQETSQNKALWLIYAEAAGAIKDPKHPKLSLQDQQRLNEKLIKQLLIYKQKIGEIEKQREQHPVPPFPSGTC